jgi:hypothetical protein
VLLPSLAGVKPGPGRPKPPWPAVAKTPVSGECPFANIPSPMLAATTEGERMTTPPPGFDPQNHYPQGQPYPQGGQYPPPQYPAAPPPPKKKKPIWLWVLGAVVALAAIGSILPDSSKTKQTPAAPSNAVTAPTADAPVASVPSATVASVPREPVEVSGSGESVQTVNLEPGGYTVQYTTERCLIVRPVKSDGSQGTALINACSGPGVTTYSSTGPATFQITNVRGPWALRFVPLA